MNLDLPTPTEELKRALWKALQEAMPKTLLNNAKVVIVGTGGEFDSISDSDLQCLKTFNEVSYQSPDENTKLWGSKLQYNLDSNKMSRITRIEDLRVGDKVKLIEAPNHSHLVGRVYNVESLDYTYITLAAYYGGSIFTFDELLRDNNMSFLFLHL